MPPSARAVAVFPSVISAPTCWPRSVGAPPSLTSRMPSPSPAPIGCAAGLETSQFAPLTTIAKHNHAPDARIAVMTVTLHAFCRPHKQKVSTFKLKTTEGDAMLAKRLSTLLACSGSLAGFKQVGGCWGASRQARRTTGQHPAAPSALRGSAPSSPTVRRAVRPPGQAAYRHDSRNQVDCRHGRAAGRNACGTSSRHRVTDQLQIGRSRRCNPSQRIADIRQSQALFVSLSGGQTPP